MVTPFAEILIVSLFTVTVLLFRATMPCATLSALVASSVREEPFTITSLPRPPAA